MAVINYRIGSTYKAPTLQEVLTPYVMYKEAFEKAEEQYIALADKANKFKYLSEVLPINSRARQIYEGYANDLMAQAQDLSARGLNYGNRSAITSLRSRYSGEIGQLDEAKTRLDKFMENRQALANAGKAMLYAEENPTIDSFLFGKSPNSYGINADELYVKGAAAGKALSEKILQHTGKSTAGYFIDFLDQKGIDPETLRRASKEFKDNLKKGFIDYVAKEFPEFHDTVMGVLSANGVTDNLTGANLRRAAENVINGAVDGAVFTQTHNIQRDPGVLSKKEEMEEARLKEGLEIQKQELKLKALETGLKIKALEASAGGSNVTGVAVVPKNIYNVKERSKNADYIEKYSKYFTVDKEGRTKLTKEGLQVYNKGAEAAERAKNPLKYTTYPPLVVNTNFQMSAYDTGFKDFVDNVLGGADLVKTRHFGELGNKFNQFIDTHNYSKHDMTKRTEFDYNFADEDKKENKSIIIKNMRGMPLYEIDMNDKGGKFTRTGDKLKESELLKDEYSVLGTTLSQYGNSVMIQTPDGVKRYELPSGINPTNEEAVNEDLAQAAMIQQIFKDKGMKDKDGNFIPLTPEMEGKFKEEYKTILQSMYLHHSQNWITNKFKAQEFNPYSILSE